MPRRRTLTPDAPAAKAALTRNTKTRVRAADALPQLIRNAHAAGLTWAEIGEFVGVPGGTAWRIAHMEKTPPVTDNGGEQEHESTTTGA